MHPETKFKVKVQAKLKLLAPEVWFERIQQTTIRGSPDILMCVLGEFVAWELKVPPNKVKAGSLQEYKLNAIVKAGGVAVEVTPKNFDQLFKELECQVFSARKQKQTPQLPFSQNQ